MCHQFQDANDFISRFSLNRTTYHDPTTQKERISWLNRFLRNTMVEVAFNNGYAKLDIVSRNCKENIFKSKLGCSNTIFFLILVKLLSRFVFLNYFSFTWEIYIPCFYQKSHFGKLGPKFHEEVSFQMLWMIAALKTSIPCKNSIAW